MKPIPFVKGHGLGNDYLVVRGSDVRSVLSAAWVRRVCDRNRGVGSDGVLVHLPSRAADHRVRIFNPDGSEAEKSGNGLRIHALYVHRHASRGARRFSVETKGGVVRCALTPRGRGPLGPLADVSVEMGRAVFDRAALPMRGRGGTLRVRIRLARGFLVANCVSVGNPHCVVASRRPEADVRVLGPLLQQHALFPKRVNVQFARVLSRHRVCAEVWERGAGYTLASGTSACAVASVFVRLGRCASPVDVSMPGGTQRVHVAPDFSLRLEGPAEEICTGTIG